MKNKLSAIIDDKLVWDIWFSDLCLPAITVCNQIKLFAQLKNKEKSFSELAAELNISLRAVEVLCQVAIAIGFLKHKTGKIHLTPSAEKYLLPESPFYWGAIFESAHSKSEHQQVLRAINDSIKTTSTKKENKPKKYGNLSSAVTKKFMSMLHAMIYAPATAAVKSTQFKTINSLLDMGGSSGSFSTAFVRKYPQKNACIFDLPNVCKQAKKTISTLQLQSKIKVQAGDFFKDPLPSGYDGILFSQIFHDWPIESCRKLAKKTYLALKPGGTIFIHEALLNKTRTGPLAIACFDLLMFMSYQTQQFTKQELFDLLKHAGFRNIKIISTFGYFSMITAKK